MRLATNRFRGSQNLTLSGWAIHGAAAGADSGAWAFGSTLDYPNDRWSARLDTRQDDYADCWNGLTKRSAGVAGRLNISPSSLGSAFWTSYVLAKAFTCASL